MNKLNFYTKLYGRLHNHGMPFWVMTPARRLVRYLANKQLPKYLSKQQKIRPRTEPNLIISFTSFPKRADNLWKVVESLKHQSVLPEKIILWLSKDQFLTKESIPQSLREQGDDLFEIRMVEKDVRSHEKYYYALLEFPEKTIITCDDDIYYDCDMVRRLVETAKIYPQCIIANHTVRITFDQQGEPLPYLQFGKDVKPFDSDNLMQLGVGGVLYPPHCLHELVTDIETFTKVAPLSDDIWLSTMARLKGTPVVRTIKDPLVLPISSNAPTLSSVNNGIQNMNDVQISQIRAWLRKKGLKDVFSSSCQVKCSVRGGVIVSLTSFPARINQVWQVIECMFRQSMQPQQILLWLSKEQFPTEQDIPQRLRDMQNDCFQIRMVDGNIRSHKKYYYASREYPNAILLLIDDDIYYPTDMIERMYHQYIKGNDIVCQYGSLIQRNEDGSLKPYTKWKPIFKHSDSEDFFFGSGGGVMFRPTSMYKDLTNIELALRLTPKADDVWLNAMERLAGLKKEKISSGLCILPVLQEKNNKTLASTNLQGGNDKQIASVNEYYFASVGRRVF